MTVLVVNVNHSAVVKMKPQSKRVSLSSRGWATSGRGSRRDAVAKRARGMSARTHAVLGGGEQHALDWLSQTLVMGLEPLYMPCSALKCGDVIHRSTLDPVLRLEQVGPNVNVFAIVSISTFTYLTLQPGILPGFFDFYFLAPLYALFRDSLSADKITLGKCLGTGGFGKVFRATLDASEGKPKQDIVVKKAYRYGPAEAWMNERLQRVCPGRVARFIDAFEGPSEGKNGRPLWLVWKFEGEGTLSDFLQQKNFPENLEEILFDEPLVKIRNPSRRRAAVIRSLMQQILGTLNDMHSTGIVHRDVKPQNILLPRKGGKLKFIDFGAAADLRIGINYLPKEFLLDPRYAPPEKYIMSTSTPTAPPPPVAALLSPILWQMNKPDRFDMYSVGILLIQMCFPSLRRDNNLMAFNRQLQKLDYDIMKWKDIIEKKRSKDFVDGISILSLDNGRGWDLLKCLINPSSGKRISASAAASHPFVSNNGLGQLPVILEKASDMLPEPVQRQSEWVADRVARSGTPETGGLTEAMMDDMSLGSSGRSRSWREQKVSNTISWWQNRENGINRRWRFWSWKTKKTISRYSKSLDQPKFSFLQIFRPNTSNSST